MRTTKATNEVSIEEI